MDLDCSGHNPARFAQAETEALRYRDCAVSEGGRGTDAYGGGEAVPSKHHRERAAFEAELAAAGYRLVRDKKHSVWRNPKGQIIVIPYTASDHRAFLNLRSVLRRQKSE